MASPLVTNGLDFDGSPLVRALHNPVTEDPAGVADGEIWYRSDLGQFFRRSDGVTLDFSSGGLVQQDDPPAGDPNILWYDTDEDPPSPPTNFVQQPTAPAGSSSLLWFDTSS